MEIFAAKDIVKRYQDYTALDNVSISVREKSIFGLLGPNGAGKTSLIRIINQITAPDSGELFFNGEKLSPKHVEMIGYLPEERGLYKKMEVGEQCLYLARLKGLSRQEAAKRLKYWFEKFEIQGWWKKKIEELSKGMQQKVQFVVTVLHEPQLIILDEPFSGFDPINANLIKNEIIELKEKGRTIILSTHNMGSVEELCDEIALINRSKKILEGNVTEIRKRYQSSTYDVTFEGNMIAFTNSFGATAELIDHRKDGDLMSARIKLAPGQKLNNILAHLIQVVQLHSVKEILPGMNDIFIMKVGQTEDSTVAGSSSFTE
jgi:ABC-2 type transport system ATP-binding protein